MRVSAGEVFNSFWHHHGRVGCGPVDDVTTMIRTKTLVVPGGPLPAVVCIVCINIVNTHTLMYMLHAVSPDRCVHSPSTEPQPKKLCAQSFFTQAAEMLFNTCQPRHVST